MNIMGILGYLASFSIIAGVYAILATGLNVQYGYTGLYNFGIAAFYAVGAYTSVLITGPPSVEHIGGFGFPILVGFAAAMIVAGVLGYLIGIPTLRLRGEFLGMSTLGIAETIRLMIKNEKWLTGGVWGLGDIPRPLHSLAPPKHYLWVYLGIVVLTIIVVYFLVHKVLKAPWGRVLKTIREDEGVASAMGKNVYRFKMQAFIFGSVLMGLAGAMYAHYVGYVSPEVFRPMSGTFIIWAMLICGGSGNNKGAILGAFIVWGVWVSTEFLTVLLPTAWATRSGYINIIVVAILFQLVLRFRPQGIIGEEKHSDN